MRVDLPPETATYSMEAWKNRIIKETKKNVNYVLEDPVRFEMRVDGNALTIDHGMQGELELAQMEAKQLMESLMHYFNVEVPE